MSRISKMGERIIPIILSFLGTCGVSYLLELTGSGYPDFNVMSVFCAAAIYILLKRIDRHLERRLIV